MELHATQCEGTNPRLADYFYLGWKVCHYTYPPEGFIACNGARVLRAETKEKIEQLIKDD